MIGFIFIVVVLLMAAGSVAVLLRGQGMLFVDPQPSYFIVEDEEPVARRAFYYPPRDHTQVYTEMLDKTRNLG